MNALEIIAAADEALRRASAPICYIHRDGHSEAFAVVVARPAWLEIMEMIPESDAMSSLAMNHGHVEGDEDQPEERHD